MSSSSSSRPRLIVSFDIEADGDSPAKNSMLSFGAVAFDETSRAEVDAMQMNLKPRAGCVQDERCMREFWANHPDVYKFVQTDQISGEAFAKRIADFWCQWSKTHTIRWVANPSAYDWQWLNFYYNLYKTAEMPNIGYSAKCMGSVLTAIAQRDGFDEDEYERKRFEFLASKMKGHVAHNPEWDARVQGLFYFDIISAVSALQ
jgi:hypothetical protein